MKYYATVTCSIQSYYENILYNSVQQSESLPRNKSLNRCIIDNNLATVNYLHNRITKYALYS
jgi:hypothetical protein